MTSTTPEQQLSQMTVAYETAMAQLFEREKNLEEKLQAYETFLANQIEKLNAIVISLRGIVAQANDSQGTFSAQEILQLGDNQLAFLQQLNFQTESLIRESCTRFERTSKTSIKKIHETVENFNLDNFKHAIEKSYEEAKQTSSTTLEKMQTILRWFQWKNLFVALGLSLLVGIIMGLYMDDEWLWESHTTIVKQRTAGEELLRAWPNLSKEDQQYIERKIATANNA